jgi:hypothetical protein
MSPDSHREALGHTNSNPSRRIVLEWCGGTARGWKKPRWLRWCRSSYSQRAPGCQRSSITPASTAGVMSCSDRRFWRNWKKSGFQSLRSTSSQRHTFKARACQYQGRHQPKTYSRQRHTPGKDLRQAKTDSSQRHTPVKDIPQCQGHTFNARTYLQCKDMPRPRQTPVIDILQSNTLRRTEHERFGRTASSTKNRTVEQANSKSSQESHLTDAEIKPKHWHRGFNSRVTAGRV